MATISLANINQPAPKLYQRISKAISLCSNGAIAILLAMGYADKAPLMLILKIGVSTALTSVEALLAENPNVDINNPSVDPVVDASKKP